MNKIIEGAKQALQSAQCDHELTLLRRPVTTAPPRFDRFSCSKCLAVLWVPIEHPQFLAETKDTK
jgi:hypothetical protein